MISSKKFPEDIVLYLGIIKMRFNTILPNSGMFLKGIVLASSNIYHLNIVLQS